jgi:hypothetical protein
MIASDFFPSVFFVKFFFLTISYFGVKLLALELCDFFTFLSIELSQVQVKQVNPG